MTVRTRSTCPSCTGELLRQILHWPSIPVNASLFPSTREESLAIPQGSFRLAACETCGLLFNADHDEELVEYSPACIETQTISARHRAFTDQLAHDWIERHGLRDASVVEVGCGPDASFLSLLRAKGNVTGTGIDPAAGEQFDGDGATLLAARFTEHHSQIPGRALICRHTLEHIPHVGEFLESVRAWSLANDDAPVLFEVPDTGRILREGAFWDLYYEHCSYFTQTTLETVFRSHGLHPERIELVYEGQYLVLDARPGAVEQPRPTSGVIVADVAEAFSSQTTNRIATARNTLQALRGDGPLVVWQAGGKALALLTLTDTTDLITGLVDSNGAKRGLFLPGTDQVILAPSEVASLEPAHVIVMNGVYVPEIERELATLGVATTVTPIDALL